MTLSIIVAMTEERVIGKDNHLPWYLPEDLKRFKKITMGHPIIMGRKTYESIGKPLPGRTNIVLTKNPDFHPDGVLVAQTLENAIQLAQSHAGGEESFVIGGETVFRAALPKANRLYLTLIHQKFSGDTWFPSVNIQKEFPIEKEPPERNLSHPIPHTYFVIDAAGGR